MIKDYDVVLRGHHLLALHAYLTHGKTEVRIALVEKHKYSKKHTNSTIRIFEKIINSNIRVKIIDALDDICEKCDDHKRKLKECKEETPFGLCAVSEDKKIAPWYGLEINEIYSSEHILKMLQKRDPVRIVLIS